MIVRCRKQDFPLVKVKELRERDLFFFKIKKLRDEMYVLIDDSSLTHGN